MTSDGTNSYAWDAENRLIKITYPGSGNFSEILYDSSGIKRQITETIANTLSSTKQFVNSGTQICEERDASNSIIKKFCGCGQTIGGSAYYYTFDRLGSIREMTDSSGALHSSYRFDLFGQRTKIAGNLDSDFQYAGYYMHAPSQLLLTVYRPYDATHGRWINRDPIRENGGINLFAYLENAPVSIADPDGLDHMGCRTVVNRKLNLDDEAWPEDAPNTKCFYGEGSLEKAKANKCPCPWPKEPILWCVVGVPMMANPDWVPPLNADGSVTNPGAVITRENTGYNYGVFTPNKGWEGAAGHPSPARGSAEGCGTQPPAEKPGKVRMCCTTCV